jgi:hypothetical protein
MVQRVGECKYEQGRVWESGGVEREGKETGRCPLTGAISVLIAGDWTFYGNIINKWYSE